MAWLSSVAAARAWLADERAVSAMDLPLTPAVVGGTSSTLGAAFNILCTVVGTGLLNLPAGFAQSGWVGAPMLIIMCTMAGYTACVLIKCFKYVGGKGSVTGELQDVLMDDVVGSSGPAETYGDIGQAAFGAFGRWFVVVQMHLTLCMVGTIYHLLAAINLISLVPHLSQPIAVLIVTAVVFGHVLLKTLSEVAAVSYVNITINAVLTVVIITSALTNPPLEAPTTTFAVSDQLSLGKAFASFGFAFGVHPVLPSVYRSMRYPQSYTRMVIAAFTCVMLFYLPMGIIGYATYGEVAPRQLPTAASSRARARRAPRQLSLATKPPSVPRPSPPQVVKSPIYETPELAKTVATKVATGLITSHLIMSYPIVLNPPERALETTLEPHVPLPPLVPPPGFTHGGPAGSRRRRLRRPSTL